MRESIRRNIDIDSDSHIPEKNSRKGEIEQCRNKSLPHQSASSNKIEALSLRPAGNIRRDLGGTLLLFLFSCFAVLLQASICAGVEAVASMWVLFFLVCVLIALSRFFIASLNGARRSAALQKSLNFRELSVATGKLFLFFKVLASDILIIRTCGLRHFLLWAVPAFVALFVAMQTQLPSPESLQSLEQETRVLSGRKTRKYGSGAQRRVSLPLSGWVQGPVRRSKAGSIFCVVRALIGGEALGNVLLELPDVPWQDVSKIKDGDFLSAKVRLTFLAPQAGEFPSIFSYHGYLLRRGLLAYGRSKSISFVERQHSSVHVKDRLVETLMRKYYYSDALAIVLAVTVGARDLPGKHLWDLFRETGTSHLLVISGFHVGLVFYLSFTFLSFLIRRIERVIIFVPVDIPSSVGAFVVAAAYTLLSGAALPAVRALFFVGVFALGKVIGRHALGCRTLLLSFILILVIWPGSCFEVGCQLSFSALIGILFAVKCLSLRDSRSKETLDSIACCSLVRSVLAALSRTVVRAFLFSFCAWLFTLPVQLVWFEAFSPWAPVTNLLCIFLFCGCFVVLGGVSVAAFFLGLPFAEYLLRLNLFLGELYLNALWRWRDFLNQYFSVYLRIESQEAISMIVWPLLAFFVLLLLSVQICSCWLARPLRG